MLAAFIAALISSAVTFLPRTLTSSVKEPVMVGTRCALPSNFPFNSGNTSPIAFAAMKAASNESFGYNEDEIVSTDIIGTHFGSLFDATQTKVLTVGDSQLVKTVSWYDNEMSYVSQLVRTVKFFAGLIS